MSFQYIPILSNLAKSWSLVVASRTSTVNSPLADSHGDRGGLALPLGLGLDPC